MRRSGSRRSSSTVFCWASASRSIGARLVGGSAIVLVPQGAGDLLRQLVVQAVDQVADVVLDVADVQVLPPPVAGIEDVQQVVEDLDDGLAAGQRLVAEVAGAAALGVGGDERLGDLGQRFLQTNVGGHGVASSAGCSRCGAVGLRRPTSSDGSRPRQSSRRSPGKRHRSGDRRRPAALHEAINAAHPEHATAVDRTCNRTDCATGQFGLRYPRRTRGKSRQFATGRLSLGSRRMASSRALARPFASSSGNACCVTDAMPAANDRRHRCDSGDWSGVCNEWGVLLWERERTKADRLALAMGEVVQRAGSVFLHRCSYQAFRFALAMGEVVQRVGRLFSFRPPIP